MIHAYFKTDLSKMDKLDRMMPDIATAGAHETAKAVVAFINRNWSPNSPSPRGGPPAKVTGRLERSAQLLDRDIQGRFTRGKEVYGTTIVYRAPYAGRLEFGDLERPFLQPAVNIISSQSGAIFGNAMRTKFRGL